MEVSTRNCNSCDGCPMKGKGCFKLGGSRRIVRSVANWILLALAYAAIGIIGGAVGHFIVCDVVHGENVSAQQ